MNKPRTPDCVWLGCHVENPQKPGTCRLCGKKAYLPCSLSTTSHQNAPRENDRTRTTYVVEARCDDCGVTESWTVDDLTADEWEDAFEDAGQAARYWMSDHHENTHLIPESDTPASSADAGSHKP